MAEQSCSRCGGKASVAPAQGGIPFGWSKVFLQVSGWADEEGKPLLVKRASDLYLCGSCGGALADALAPVKGG